jgi:phage terminase large subunit GpA-like protein
MEAVSDSTVETVVVMAGSQLGKTESCLNVIGFHIDVDPGPIMVVQPRDRDAEKWSKKRLIPMLRDSPSLRGKVNDDRGRGNDNTILEKSFPGGRIVIVGSNSPSGLAGDPIRVLLCDEVDHFRPSAGAEGDPITLARRRTSNFWNRKVVLTSTPTIKGASRIEAAFEASDQRRFFVPCGACGHEQTLRWERVEWDKDERGEHLPETAAYRCESCGAKWGDGERKAAVRLGRWQATRPFTGTAGFHLSALYSPWVELEGLVSMFVEAKAFPEQLKAFVNLTLGETWEEKGEQLDEGSLLSRREHYGPEIPAAVSIITAGIDTQDDRLEVELVGWGVGEECWSLDFRVIRGDPSTNVPWRDLDALLLEQRRRADGIVLPVAAACLDTGGHHTQAAYAFARERYGRRVWATKGVGGSRPIWPRKPSRNNVGKTPLFLIGVDSAKELIVARLRLPSGQLASCHFPDRYDVEYFEQLTGEKVLTKYHRGFARRQWVKTRARNEALDCRVLNVAALAGLLSMGLSLSREAERLEGLVNAVRVGTLRAGEQTFAPRRRVRSPGIELGL